eukprot:11219138-Lingulodinium_polyedra.AAC.1
MQPRNVGKRLPKRAPWRRHVDAKDGCEGQRYLPMAVMRKRPEKCSATGARVTGAPRPTGAARACGVIP